MTIYNTVEIQQQENAFQQLTLLQHYGIPTRLLDWSSNPLVALYFATDSSKQEDGEVIIYTPPKTYLEGGSREKLITSLCKGIGPKVNLQRFIKIIDRDSSIYYIEKDKESIEKNIQDVILVRPKVNSRRLDIQRGVFTLHGNKIIEKNGKKYIDLINPISIPSKDVIRIKIPFESKKEIRRELNLLGYNKGTLFPDLENYATYIKNKFKNSSDSEGKIDY